MKVNHRQRQPEKLILKRITMTEGPNEHLGDINDVPGSHRSRCTNCSLLRHCVFLPCLLSGERKANVAYLIDISQQHALCVAPCVSVRVGLCVWKTRPVCDEWQRANRWCNIFFQGKKTKVLYMNMYSLNHQRWLKETQFKHGRRLIVNVNEFSYGAIYDWNPAACH